MAHHPRLAPGETAEDRFWTWVAKGTIEDCWPWKGFPDTRGYGAYQLIGGRHTARAHRLAYEFIRGPIPAGFDLDHLCHSHDPLCPGGRQCLHRLCVNPWHLEIVDRRTNILRGRGLNAIHAQATTCRHGHPYSEENTRWYTWPRTGETHRVCRACQREYAQKKRTALKTEGDLSR